MAGAIICSCLLSCQHVLARANRTGKPARITLARANARASVMHAGEEPLTGKKEQGDAAWRVLAAEDAGRRKARKPEIFKNKKAKRDTLLAF